MRVFFSFCVIQLSRVWSNSGQATDTSRLTRPAKPWAADGAVVGASVLSPWWPSADTVADAGTASLPFFSFLASSAAGPMGAKASRDAAALTPLTIGTVY